ncbi:elongation factor G, partial [Candidatus Gottesmanbacteria bacterium]|nr:elongation factor G [Candidatus Gottesmanbacteria bacterium]
VPRICFVNKMDKVGANFERTVAMIEDRLGARTAVMVYPLGREHDFTGVVDLLEQKVYTWGSDELGTKYEISEIIPPQHKDAVEQARKRLLERISESDDALLEKFVGGVEPSNDELGHALRRATISYKLVPVYCGTSLRNKGVQPLLDAIVNYLPSPQDINAVVGVNPKKGDEEVRKQSVEEPFSGLAFKIQVDPHVGKLTYIRIYSGTLASGSYIYNATKDKKERVSRLLLMHANTREEIASGFAGEIVAAVGLKDTSTGDTVCEERRPILLETIKFPEPVISLAIEPKTKADQEKMGSALQRLAEEDPTFRIKSNIETNQTIIWGMGELHLEVIVDRMRREFSVAANVGAPQVAYKETIKLLASGEGK